MKLEQIVNCVQEGKKQTSRFPVRVILVDSLSHYKQLVDELAQLCDRVVGLAEYCQGEDTFPLIDRLKFDLFLSSNQTIMILSMAEYLRLGYKRELPGTEKPQFIDLFNEQQDSLMTRKIYIPLFACGGIFEQIVGRIDERHKDHIWYLDSNMRDEHFVLCIYSPEFRGTLKGKNIIFGIKEWLKIWDNGLIQNSYSLITKRYTRTDIAHGVYSINKITDIFAYVVNGLENGNHLKRIWGTDNQWSYMASLTSYAKTVEGVINYAHNMANFDPLSVLAKWSILEDGQKWFLWLWYQLNTKSDYISFAISTAKHYTKIPQAIKNAVFIMPTHDESSWMQQRDITLNIMQYNEMDEEFWVQLKATPDRRKRLKLLSYKTHEERAFAIKTVSELLSAGQSFSDIIALIETKYELLVDYLQPSFRYEWTELEGYFKRYKEQKLKNEYTYELINDIDKVSVVCENADTRYSAIKKHIDEHDKIFMLWIDGMGAEWAGLLLSRIHRLDSTLQCSFSTCKAMLPTETQINDQWGVLNVPFQKLDRLDKLAHKGEPDDTDYFSCIAKQLAFIEEVAQKAIKYLTEYDAVIITADHGTSRMAALAFHNLVGVNPPVNATVKSFGRYCELNGEALPEDKHPNIKVEKREGKNYLIFRTHEHYKQSANAAGKNEDGKATVGEIHGGMTPEEELVPVIALYHKKQIVKRVNYTLGINQIKPDGENRVTIPIKLTSKATTLQVLASGQAANCSTSNGINWDAIFDKLSIGSHELDVYADNRLLDKHEGIMVVTRGLVINDDL